MTPSDLQIWATSALISALEKIISDDLIKDEAREMKLRVLMNDASRAFNIPTIAERPAANSNEFDYEAQLAAVDREMLVQPRS